MCLGRQFAGASTDPVLTEVHFRKADGAARIGVLRICTHRQQGAHDLGGGPGDCCDGGNPEPLVDLRATWIVDARDDVFDRVGLTCNASRQDVRVVPATYGCECVRTLYAGVFQGLSVETDALDGQPTEIRAQLPEGMGVLVDDGDGMTLSIEIIGECGPDPAAAQDHDVHAVTLHACDSYPDDVSRSVGGRPANPDMPVKKGSELELVVGKIAHGGHMVARWGDLVIFVRHGIPGERVRVRITEVRARFARGDVIEVLQADPERRKPPCPVAGSCGGCDFQHIPEMKQRSLKLDVLRESLIHQGRLASERVDELLVDGVMDLGRQLHWRSRMHYRTIAGSNGQATLALHRFRSDELVDVSTCVIADHAGHRLAMDLAATSLPGTDVYMAVGNEQPIAANRPGKSSIARHDVTIGEATLQFRVPIDGFWQVHPDLVTHLARTVLEWGNPATGETWWDLYAGVGPIAAALAARVGPTGTVMAVENAALAVREGERSLRTLPWVRWHRSDVRRFVRRALGRTHPRPDGVVLDPPRSGAGAVIVDAVVDMGPRAVIIVACDPLALGRDTAHLESRGYRLEAVRAFDAFPQTHHLETVALFAPADQIS